MCYHTGRVVFAALEGDPSAGLGLARLSAPSLRIEDTEFVGGQLTINPPAEASVSLLGLQLEGVTLAIRTPPPHPEGTERSRRLKRGHRETMSPQGLVEVASVEEEATFTMVSTQITSCRGTLAIAGAAVFVSDTVVSHHAGPWLVCAPGFRGEPSNGEPQGRVLLQVIHSCDEPASRCVFIGNLISLALPS
jgi:hypothetical protein